MTRRFFWLFILLVVLGGTACAELDANGRPDLSRLGGDHGHFARY